MRSPLLAIVFIALIIRLYGLTTPVADWHAFRQADTASVTREYVKHGLNPLTPRYHDLSNIQSGKDNLDGYRMVEFPLTHIVLAGVLKAIPILPLVATSRLVSVIFSLGTLVSLYYLVVPLSGKKTALVTALIFALLPYSIFYSRVILPEPVMLFFSTASLMAYYRWLITKKIGWYLTAFISLALALLLKPFVLFLFPVYAGLLAFHYFNETTRRFFWKGLLIDGFMSVPGLVVSILPMLAWRVWIQRFPSGIPANDWLFNGNLIRFRPAWFRWLFYERLTKLILGYAGSLFLLANLWPFKKDLLVYGSWWLGILAYFSIIATGNVQHDYYQVIALPIICLSVGRGLVALHTWLTNRLSPQLSFLPIAIIAGAMIIMAWDQVKGYYNVNHWEYIRTGTAVDQLTPTDAKVIAPAFGDTHFLFQTNRTGWPIGFEIDDKIAKGATHYVSTSYDDEARMLEQKYHVISKTSEYILIDLRTPR